MSGKTIPLKRDYRQTFRSPQIRFCQKSLYCYICNQRQLSESYSLLEIAASCFSCSFFVVVDVLFFFVLIFRFIFVFACQDYYIYSFKRRLATGWLFSPGTPVSFTDKTDLQDIAEILLKMVLNNIKQNCQAPK